MDDNDLALLEKLGLDEVLLEMAKGEGRLGRPSSQVREEVEHWVEREKIKLASTAAATRDAREEETLSIARDANNIASRAERWAMYAAIAAVIALIISIVRSQN